MGGLHEHQRLLWLLSRFACAEVNQAMLEFTKVYYNTGEQSQDMTKSRIHFKCTFTYYSLEFMPTLPLMFIMPGKLRRLKSMDGRTNAEYTFIRKSHAVTRGTNSPVKIDGH